VVSVFNALPAVGGGLGMVVADGLSMPKSSLADSRFSTYPTPKLLQMLAQGQIDTQPPITHHLRLDEMLNAYDVFADAGANGALKSVLTRN